MVPVIVLGFTQSCKLPCYLVTLTALFPLEPTYRNNGGLLGMVISSWWQEVGFDIIGHYLGKGSLNKPHITTLLRTVVWFWGPGHLKVHLPPLKAHSLY